MLDKKKVQFNAKISKQGTKRIIIIPVNYHSEIDDMVGQTVKVTLEETVQQKR